MTDSLTEWLEYAGICDAMLCSDEAGRTYCVSEIRSQDIWAIEGQTHKLCWALSDGFGGPWDICADTARGKLYCGSWPMGVSIVDLNRRVVTANLATVSSYGYPVSGCIYAPLSKNYVLEEEGGILVLDAVADTVAARLSLDSTLEWSFTACAATAGRVLCTAKDTGYAVLIDCARDSVVIEVRLGSAVGILETGRDGTTFIAATSGHLYVMEASTGAILDSLKTGPHPSGLCHVSPLHKFYLADTGECRLYVLNSSLDSVIGRVEIDGKPYGLCYDSVDSKLYVACRQDDAIWVVDCAADTVRACIELEGSGRPSPPVYSAFGNRVYFTSGDSLGIIECDQDKVAARFPRRFHQPSTPRVFSPLRLVSVTSEDQFITLLSDPPARPAVVSAAQGREPTVAKGMLRVTGARTGQLFDLSGRNVLDLLPGWNDVSGLSPGIYFAREQTADGSKPAKTRKVVILR